MARGLDSGGQAEAAVLAAVTDGEGNRALHLAAAAGRVEVCRYIVEDLRLDVNQPNFKGETPLFYSAFFGGAAAARYLIDHGADPLAGKIWSPLHGAAAKGADVNFVDFSRITNVILAVQYGLPGTVQCLLDAGANPNIPDEDKRKCEKRRTGLKQKAKEAFQREEYFIAAQFYSCDYEKACEAFADGLKLDPKSAEIANALREAREAAKNAH
ncbi:hypothetical protein ACQ4PT_037122 [Festuca glaucescens]